MKVVDLEEVQVEKHEVVSRKWCKKRAAFVY